MASRIGSGDVSWLAPGQVLATFWPRPGSSWLSLGYVLATFWLAPGSVSAAFCVRPGQLLAKSWLRSGYATARSWLSLGNVLATSWLAPLRASLLAPGKGLGYLLATSWLAPGQVLATFWLRPGLGRGCALTLGRAILGLGCAKIRAIFGFSTAGGINQLLILIVGGVFRHKWLAHGRQIQQKCDDSLGGGFRKSLF